ASFGFSFRAATRAVSPSASLPGSRYGSARGGLLAVAWGGAVRHVTRTRASAQAVRMTATSGRGEDGAGSAPPVFPDECRPDRPTGSDNFNEYRFKPAPASGRPRAYSGFLFPCYSRPQLGPKRKEGCRIEGPGTSQGLES